jgi:D-glycero-alpha-D-manno-heptose 1-phosphate guanylyltransferase
MKREAVILAGGLGTRLKSMVADLPKPMAPVNNLPFLFYLLELLHRYKFDKIILAAGYRYEVMERYFGSSFKGMKLVYSVEKEPLGTGGAILKASALIKSDYFFVINGDTFFETDINRMEEKFLKSKTGLMLALKPMSDFERYGTVVTKSGKITSFNEKKPRKEGLINGGIYIVRKDWLGERAPGKEFSFEKDILERYVTSDDLGYYISDGYFIDIGVPEDYLRAAKELPEFFGSRPSIK